jgi:hypothetical protein
MDRNSIIILIIVLICVVIAIVVITVLVLKLKTKETGKSCGEKAKKAGLCCETQFDKIERDSLLKPMETMSAEKLLNADINDIYKFLLCGLLKIYRKSTKTMDILYPRKTDRHDVISTIGSFKYEVYVYRKFIPNTNDLQCFLFAPEIKSNYDDLMNAAKKDSLTSPMPEYIKEAINQLTQKIKNFFSVPTNGSQKAYIYLIGEGDSSALISELTSSYAEIPTVGIYSFSVGSVPVLPPDEFSKEVIYIYSKEDAYFDLYSPLEIPSAPFPVNPKYTVTEPGIGFICRADYHDFVYYSKFVISKI